jgi:hypothetical protein
MPYEVDIVAGQRLVRVRMWGAITRAEIMAITEEIAADPRMAPGYSELIDLTAITSSTSVTEADIRTIAMSNLDPATRRAFVTVDALTFGLARMFETLREIHQTGERVAVFKTVDAAEAWLVAEAGS